MHDSITVHVTPLQKQMLDAIARLDVEMQRETLTYIRKLALPKGKSGAEMVKLTQDLSIDAEELLNLQRIIDEEFGQVNADDWDVSAG